VTVCPDPSRPASHLTLPESEELPVEVELDASEELDDVEEDLDLCRLFLRLLSLSAAKWPWVCTTSCPTVRTKQSSSSVSN